MLMALSTTPCIRPGASMAGADGSGAGGADGSGAGGADGSDADESDADGSGADGSGADGSDAAPAPPMSTCIGLHTTISMLLSLTR